MRIFAGRRSVNLKISIVIFWRSWWYSMRCWRLRNRQFCAMVDRRNGWRYTWINNLFPILCFFCIWKCRPCRNSSHYDDWLVLSRFWESQTAYIYDFRASILLMWICNFHSKSVGPKTYLGRPSSCQNMLHTLRRISFLVLSCASFAVDWCSSHKHSRNSQN